MMSRTEYLTFQLPERMGFLNITDRVAGIVAASGVQEGLVLVNAMHITASVFINDDEPGLHADYRRWLEQLALLMLRRPGMLTIAREKTMPTRT